MSAAVHWVKAGDTASAQRHGLTLLARCGLTYTPHPNGVESELPSCAACERISGPIDRTPRQRFNPDTRPTYVYRHYDGDGRLLYVGCTFDPRTRQHSHQQNSWWFNQSVRVRLTVYPNRLHALRVERDVIRTERPLWNVRHQDYSGWDREQLRLGRTLARKQDAPPAVLKRFTKLGETA